MMTLSIEGLCEGEGGWREDRRDRAKGKGRGVDSEAELEV